MKRWPALFLVASLALGARPAPAHAWETSTHVGMAEQAALAGGLDAWLRALGLRGGLFEPLTIPPADAPELFAALANHSAIDGFVPDLRGQQAALAWLLAGAALADANPTWAANHFYDADRKVGWRAPTGLVDRARAKVEGVAAARAGVAAPDWAASGDNPLGLPGFIDQYDKAIRAATPGERGRHLAGALVAAGAMLHVLGDLGSPSRTRGDSAAFFDPLGDAAFAGDRGSRFERLVAIGWGRLGVPAAADVPARTHFRDFFTGAGTGTTGGLAEWSAHRFFSEHTLPRASEVGRATRTQLPAVIARSLVRPQPTPPRLLSMVVATQPQGTTLRDATGVCLAHYRKDRGVLSWWLDDSCELDQAAAILPVAAGYQAALLRWLGRGQLAVSVVDGAVQVRARGSALGAGELTVLTEDGRGVRAAAGTAKVTTVADGALVGAVQVGAGRSAVAVFRGVDAAGEPIVAVGAVELP
ncbi:MAG: hypothetical protein R3B06_32855 [Kofleriaceae bacterium]